MPVASRPDLSLRNPVGKDLTWSGESDDTKTHVWECSADSRKVRRRLHHPRENEPFDTGISKVRPDCPQDAQTECLPAGISGWIREDVNQVGVDDAVRDPSGFEKLG